MEKKYISEETCEFLNISRRHRNMIKMIYATGSSLLIIQYNPDSFIPLPLRELPLSQTVNVGRKKQKKKTNKKNPNAAVLENYRCRTQSDSLNNGALLNTSEEVKETKGSCQHACRQKKLSTSYLAISSTLDLCNNYFQKLYKGRVLFKDQSIWAYSWDEISLGLRIRVSSISYLCCWLMEGTQTNKLILLCFSIPHL